MALLLTGADKANFNPDEGFGPGDFFRDDWFLGFQELTNLGYDFYFHSSEVITYSFTVLEQ